MGHRGSLIRCAGLRDKVRKVLTANWQSAALIAAQITIPPEAGAREALRTSGHTRNGKTSLVSHALSKMRGVEKRKINGGFRNEYRLKEMNE